MAYSTGMMNKRVTVAKRAPEPGTAKSGQRKYVILGTFWMSETFNKGTKSMHEGALDAYDAVMFRCRYNKDIDRWCLLQYNGKWYQITSFNEDYHDNQLQMTAVELSNQQVTILTKHEIEVWGNAACTERPDGDVHSVYAQFNVEVNENKFFENKDFDFTVDINDYPDYSAVLFNGYAFFNLNDFTVPIAAGTVIELENNDIRTLSKDADYSFGQLV